MRDFIFRFCKVYASALRKLRSYDDVRFGNLIASVRRAADEALKESEAADA